MVSFNKRMMKRIGIFAGIFLITFLFWAPPAAFAAGGTNTYTTAQKEACAKVLGVKIDDTNFVNLCLNSAAAAYAVGQATTQTTAGTQTAASSGGGGGFLGTILSFATGVFEKPIIWLIDTFIGGVVKIFVSLAAVFVNWAIDINYTITDIKSESFAHFGWGLTLNFANLLFVLAIVVIAFGIMFRRAWAKKSLPKLIIIALLINFSFFIATELIKISDSITKVFVNTDTLDLGSFINFFTNIPSNVSTIGSGLGGEAAEIFSPIFAMVFGFIAVLTLLAVAVAFFIRYISLTILLILLPLALGMSLLPIKVGKMPNAWQEWQDNFFKWLLFGPVMAFFIYLSFALLKHPPNIPVGGFVQAFGSELGDKVALIGILLGGLMVANKMGVAGAATFDGYIKKGQAWGQNMAKGGARSMANSMANRVLTAGARPGIDGGAPRPSHAQRLSNRLIGIPGLRGVATGISGATQDIGKNVTKTQEKFKSYDKDTFLRLVKTTKFADPAKKAAFAMELAKRNLTDQIDPSKLDELLKSAAQVSRADPTGTSTKTIIANRPDLAKSLGMLSIADAMKKITKPDEISPISFNSSEVVLNLSNANLERLAKAGTDEQRDKIKATLGNIRQAGPMTATHARIDNFITNNPNWQ